MYVTITNLTGVSDGDPYRDEEAAPAMHDTDGFRWAMRLRSTQDAAEGAAVAMWLTKEHEEAWRQADKQASAGHGYEVAVARGAMTPAAAVAIVQWKVGPAEADRFVARWNAAYHAVEDVIGSRLLHDPGAPGAYLALHAAAGAEGLDRDVLAAALTDGEGLAAAPAGVQRFAVLHLTEAP